MKTSYINNYVSLKLFNMGHILWDKAFIYVYVNKKLNLLYSVLVFRIYNCLSCNFIKFSKSNSTFYSEDDAKSLDNHPIKDGGSFHEWCLSELFIQDTR